MSRGRLLAGPVLLVLVVAPFVPMGGVQQYVLHVVIQIFIWSFIGQAWSLMGRFGLVSLGHGAFLGVGAYTTTLLWNFYSLTPWIGGLLAVAAAVAIAVVLGIPCFRFRVIGHYFALVTLAVGEVIRLLIIAERDWTGGSLGASLKTAGTASGLWTLQFADKRVFYYASLAMFLAGLWVWDRVDRSMARSALEAIGEDETAAASVGIHVTRFKLGITVVSAAPHRGGRGPLRAVHLLRQPGHALGHRRVAEDRVRRGAGRHVLADGSRWSGTALTTALAEGLRIAFGLKFLGHGRDHLRAAAHHLHHLPALRHLRLHPRSHPPPLHRDQDHRTRVAGSGPACNHLRVAGTGGAPVTPRSKGVRGASPGSRSPLASRCSYRQLNLKTSNGMWNEHAGSAREGSGAGDDPRTPVLLGVTGSPRPPAPRARGDCKAPRHPARRGRGNLHVPATSSAHGEMLDCKT